MTNTSRRRTPQPAHSVYLRTEEYWPVVLFKADEERSATAGAPPPRLFVDGDARAMARVGGGWRAVVDACALGDGDHRLSLVGAVGPSPLLDYHFSVQAF